MNIVLNWCSVVRLSMLQRALPLASRAVAGICYMLLGLPCFSPSAGAQPYTISHRIGLTGSSSYSTVVLKWNTNSDRVLYNVMRSATSGGPYTTIQEGVTDGTYTDKQVTLGTSYYYVVARADSAVRNMISNEVHVTPYRQMTVDAMIRNWADQEYIGSNVHTRDGVAQEKGQAALRDNPGVYVIKVLNTDINVGRLRLTADGAMTDWNVSFYDAVNGGTNITDQVMGAGWETPVLEPNAGCEIRVEAVPAKKGVAVPECDILVKAASLAVPVQFDTARVFATVQFVAGLEYSVDGGVKYVDAPPSGTPLTIKTFDAVVIQPLKGYPTLPWPKKVYLLKPGWIEAEGARIKQESFGSSYCVHYDTPSEAMTVTAECGNSVSMNLKIIKSPNWEEDKRYLDRVNKKLQEQAQKQPRPRFPR